MSFVPCQDLCTTEGSYCEGCGRSHQEIANTKKLVKAVTALAIEQGYDNIDEFAQYFAKKVIKNYRKSQPE